MCFINEVDLAILNNRSSLVEIHRIKNMANTFGLIDLAGQWCQTPFPCLKNLDFPNPNRPHQKDVSNSKDSQSKYESNQSSIVQVRYSSTLLSILWTFLRV
jgi:hypothetical protein